MKLFTVYSRSDCHLCDVMIERLHVLAREHTFSVEVVDIDGDAALVHEYGFFVPVLSFDGQKVCHYELDEKAFLSYLSI